MKADPSAQKPIEQCVSSLPYPLGFTAVEWLQAEERVKRGEDVPRLPFLICRVMGVAMRFASAMAIRALVEARSGGGQFHARVVQVLRAPSDGGWLEIASRVARDVPGNPWARVLNGLLRSAHRPSHEGWEGTRKVTVLDALGQLVAFRNELVHGDAPDRSRLQKASANLEVVLRGFSRPPIHALRVRSGGNEWAIDGRRPRSVRAQELILPPELPEGQVFLVDRGMVLPPLSLSPLVVWRSRGEGDATVDVDELWFLNAGDSERLGYISYRTNGARDGRELESYDAFKKLLAALPTPPVPADPKFDFSGLAAFHGRLFVGRSDVLDEMEALVRRGEGKWGVLTALPGMGKTAIMSRLYAQHALQPAPGGDVWVFHFCGPTGGRNSPTATLRSLVAQLCDHAKLDRSAWLSNDLDALRDKSLPALVSKVAEGLPTGRRLVFAIDALDEGFGAERESVGAALRFALPPNAAGLLSWRVPGPGRCNESVEASIQHLAKDRRVGLLTASPLLGLTKDDVLLVLRKLGAERGLEPAPEVVEATWRAAMADCRDRPGADPFFLRLVADSVWSGETWLNRAETVPQSLDDAFEKIWTTLSVERDLLAHHVLAYLAILREPGNDELMANLLARERPGESVTNDDIALVRFKISKLLVYQGDSYWLFHDRFRDFLVGEEKDPLSDVLRTSD